MLKALSIAPGWPSWGGGKRIMRKEVWPIVEPTGIRPTSGKRRETFGNPSSDHYWLNVYSFAKDFATANNQALAQKIRSKLDPGGTHLDYENFFFVRTFKRRFRRPKRYTFRGQIIAGTHGTGPHLHVGIKRES